jgi:hypothetical protein
LLDLLELVESFCLNAKPVLSRAPAMPGRCYVNWVKEPCLVAWLSRQGSDARKSAAASECAVIR